jgi:hypothetical protein
VPVSSLVLNNRPSDTARILGSECTRMAIWEYASLLNDGPAAKAQLDVLGDDGWQLVSVIQGAQTKQFLYVFKREKTGA